MKFSVIVPLYNQSQYVADCIHSVISQTKSAHEIIVINDGSTDEPEKVLSRFPNIKVINQVNKGLASARNTGIMNATGDYILPLDADDFLEDNCLQRISEVAELTNADVISPSFKEFGLRNTKIILMPEPTIEHFKYANRIGYCSAIKRGVLLEVGGYNPKMIYGWEDFDIWFDLLKRGKTIITIPEILWYYRTKEVSMYTESVKHEKELWAQIYKNHPEIWATSQN